MATGLRRNAAQLLNTSIIIVLMILQAFDADF